MALADSGGDLNEALQLTRSVVGRNSENLVFADALGWVYLKRKENANAIQTFRAVVAKAPQTVSYRIHLASALAQSGNPTAARAELAATLSRNPTAEERKEITSLGAKQ